MANKELTAITNQITKKYNLQDWHVEFLQYLMLPKALRPSRHYICGRFGISLVTYHQWLRDPRINNARRDYIKQYYKDDIPDVLYAMKAEALAGNERAARLFLEYVDDFDKHDNPPPLAPLFSPSEIQITINKLEQKFYGNSKQGHDQCIEGEIGS